MSDGNYNKDGTPTNYGLSLIIHEAKHLEQGPTLAHSKLGEMQAWQIQEEVYVNLTGKHYWGSDLSKMKSVVEFSEFVQKEVPGYRNRNPIHSLQNNICVGLCSYPDYPNGSSGIGWWFFDRFF